MLQPLIENSVKHAFTDFETNNFIQVNVLLLNDELTISIHDNGKPFPDKIIPGYGLKNVTDKLQLLLPDKHELQITNTPLKQLKITIKELKKKYAEQ